MTNYEVKARLRKIRIYDQRIDAKIRELGAIEKQQTYVGGMNYEDDRVQTSADGTSGALKLAEKIVDMQREINEMIDRYIDLRHEIVEEINSLEDERYIAILAKRYIAGKSFEEICSEMKLSYHRTCHLHGEALFAYAAKVSN